MISKLKILLAVILFFILISLNSCGTGQVSVGVGVYVPGAWGGAYGPGYYPPVRVGYPVY